MLVDAIVETIRVASIYLPPDIKNALREAYKHEEGMAKAQLGAILKNIELAEDLKRPICQDTGLITFYVTVGDSFPLSPIKVKDALIRAVKIATEKIPLRPNSVDPITGKNTGDNTGRLVPIIHWDTTEGEQLEIIVIPKGGGSEYPVVLKMVPPGKGLSEIPKVVLEAVLNAGAMPCPPTIVGVGIGGNAEVAISLAKKAATVRKVNSKNENDNIAELEKKLKGMANRLGIGPMGVGGKTTVLDVNIEYAHRHPATFPVGVAFQCWAARRATLTVFPNGEWEITQ